MCPSQALCSGSKVYWRSDQAGTQFWIVFRPGTPGVGDPDPDPRKPPLVVQAEAPYVALQANEV
ncbi:MAG: hypothetical protein M1833_003030 [Piccolia ochrophora]|nr:MAG: hypothetical protein M1833_003030 [Piccolia ochrophora]